MGNETGEAEVTGGGVMTPSSSLDVLSEAPTHADADTAVPEGDAAEVRAAVSATNVPTVLSKLQKWGDYASYGEPVAPSRFIPMKTPLSPSLLQGNTFENVLTVPAFLAAQQAHGRVVGLIIDLSNHDCLYLDGVPEAVQRVHVRNVAKSIPNIQCTSEVIATAADFWAHAPEEYIAIHCAYGFNRTGFVLCCYLIEVCGLSAEDALASFATARDPGVKHDRFKEALRCRYPTPGCAPVVVCEEDIPRCSSHTDVHLHSRNESLDLDVTTAPRHVRNVQNEMPDLNDMREAVAEAAAAAVAVAAAAEAEGVHIAARSRAGAAAAAEAGAVAS